MEQNWTLYPLGVDFCERNVKCTYCKKTILGKQREWFSRTVRGQSALNLCAPCLRRVADEIDKLNKEPQHG